MDIRKSFYNTASKALEQVAQGNHECPNPDDIQGQAGQGSEM